MGQSTTFRRGTNAEDLCSRAWWVFLAGDIASVAFGALAADRSIPGMPDPQTLLGEGSREQQMQNFKTAVLDRVKSAVELVARKGSADEAAAYRAMLADVAERAASASNEGGFLGFGGVRVSDKESAFISEVRRAAGVA